MDELEKRARAELNKTSEPLRVARGNAQERAPFYVVNLNANAITAHECTIGSLAADLGIKAA